LSTRAGALWVCTLVAHITDQERPGRVPPADTWTASSTGPGRAQRPQQSGQSHG